jgi:predicted small integral membrane protein
MYSTAFLFRIAKATSVAAIGLMALLVAIGNTTEYYTNYLFVEHVLKMDTTFPNSSIHYRSINEPFRKPKFRPNCKIALPVIKINQFPIRGIIANGNIKEAISIEISQPAGI